MPSPRRYHSRKKKQKPHRNQNEDRNTRDESIPETAGTSSSHGWRSGRRYQNEQRERSSRQVRRELPRNVGCRRRQTANDWSNPRSCSTSGEEVNSQESTESDLDIPGFYYDKAKKRYFKILPGQSGIAGMVTRESIKSKLAEEKRQEDLMEIGKKLASSYVKQHSASEIHPMCILRRPQFSENICTFLERMRCSYFVEQLNSSVMSEKESVKHLASRIKPSGKLKIFENPGSPYEKLEHMMHLKVNKEQDKILCLWGLKELIVQRIQMLNINGINKYDDDGGIDLDISPTGAVLLQSFSKVTDMCWAPLEGSDPQDCCILYTTTCFLGNNPSLALLRRLDADSAQGFRHTEFNLGQKATWSCAWNGKNNQLSVGSEGCALLLDVPTRRMWELHTGNSDVHSQAFQTDGTPTLYSGTKKGIIFGHDLRSNAARPVILLKQKSCVCQLQFPRNKDYIYAADFTGKIKQWDLRQRKVVLEFHGNNEYSRTPFHIDTTETVITAAGQDCYTRIWDIRSGDLLTSIPPPHPASRDTIPPCYYFTLPCSTVRQPGLLMGSHDELHFYSNH